MIHPDLKSNQVIIIDSFVTDGYKVTEFLLDGTLNVIVKKMSKREIAYKEITELISIIRNAESKSEFYVV